MTLATSIQMNANGFGGIIQGNFGTYQAGSDGTVTVDSRDVPALLVMGMTYVAKRNVMYRTPSAPAVASAAVLIASLTLSNGSVTIAAQPDVMRQAQVVVTSASPGPTAGTVSISYIGNDGVTTTDVISLITVGATPATHTLSKGVQFINSATIAGLVGGTAPVWMELGTTSALSVPVDPGAQDVTFLSAQDDAGNQTLGTPVVGVLGTITVNPALNATHTYSWGYTMLSVDS